MAIRSTAVAGLALAAALTLAGPSRAQGFFSFFDMSPRQIADMLADDGYRLRGPLYRRGDVYVCDVVSVSGRPARLIVNAHDGRIVERYGAHASRARSPYDDYAPRGASHDGGRFAYGDPYGASPRVFGGDDLSGPKPDDAGKAKRHAVKKHKEPSVAKAPASEPTSAPDTPAKPAAAPAASTAAVAPSSPAPAPKETAKPAPPPAQAKVEAEKPAPAKPAAAPAKPEPERKKLNDLPVGTLD